MDVPWLSSMLVTSDGWWIQIRDKRRLREDRTLIIELIGRMELCGWLGGKEYENSSRKGSSGQMSLDCRRRYWSANQVIACAAGCYTQVVVLQHYWPLVSAQEGCNKSWLSGLRLRNSASLWWERNFRVSSAEFKQVQCELKLNQVHSGIWLTWMVGKGEFAVIINSTHVVSSNLFNLSEKQIFLKRAANDEHLLVLYSCLISQIVRQSV